MRSLAGPAMLLVLFGGFAFYRGCASEDHPPRTFLDLEFAGADAQRSGSCYSLETVLFTNRMFSKATRTWSSPRKGAWTLTLDEVTQAYNGPVHTFQKLTFEKSGEQVRLVDIEASKGIPTDIAQNVDALLVAPNDMTSTAIERCVKDGGTGYRYVARKK
jgi:hypothetical protein